MMLDKLPDRLNTVGSIMKDSKMSTQRNVVTLKLLVERYGLDPLRYLMHAFQSVQMRRYFQKTIGHYQL